MEFRETPSERRQIALWAGRVLVLLLVVSYVGLGIARDRFGIRAKRQIDKALVWWPWRARCEGGNATSAISTLRNVWSSQYQFVAEGHVDQDGDGRPEFGTFAELSGAAALRGSPHALRTPLTSGAFRTAGPDGTISRSGYRFRLFLVGKDGEAVAERAGGGRKPVPRSHQAEGCLSDLEPVPVMTAGGIPDDLVDPDGCETHWVGYAWPDRYDFSGLRTFVVDADGGIWTTEDKRYSGTTGPLPGAAFATGGIDSIGTTAGGAGQDGNVWRQVN